MGIVPSPVSAQSPSSSLGLCCTLSQSWSVGRSLRPKAGGPQGGTFPGLRGPCGPSREGLCVHMHGVLLPLTPMMWPSATETPIMVAGEPDVRRLSVDAKTQSTICRVRTSSTATAWPVETLLRT